MDGSSKVTKATKAKTETFTLNTVAVLVYALSQQGKNINKEDLELMSYLDGKRTTDAFEHSFRAVKARAREIGEMKAAGVKIESVPTSRKRPSASKENAATTGDSACKQPSKKQKSKTNAKQKKSETNANPDGAVPSSPIAEQNGSHKVNQVPPITPAELVMTSTTTENNDNRESYEWDEFILTTRSGDFNHEGIYENPLSDQIFDFDFTDFELF